MTTFGEVKFVCFGTVKVAPNVVSTKFAFAHSPMPSARAHLIRRLSATPSPQGEGSVSAYFEGTNIYTILPVRHKIVRTPQARPLVEPTALSLPALYNFIARSATRNCGDNKHTVLD